mgnify:FL=1
MYVDNEEETSFRSDVGDCIDYYFMYGGSADGVICTDSLADRFCSYDAFVELWIYAKQRAL